MARLEITVPPPADLSVSGAGGSEGGAPRKAAAAPVITPDILSTLLPLALTPPIQQEPSVGSPTRAIITINIH